MQPVVLPSQLSLFSVSAVSEVMTQSAASFSPLFISLTFPAARPSCCALSLFLFFFYSLSPFPPPSVRLSAILSPYTLRSTTQQPLNYSHQTTLCIFLAVPLHSSRMLLPPPPPPRLIVAVRAHSCVHAQLHMFPCLCDPASVWIFAASLDGS